MNKSHKRLLKTWRHFGQLFIKMPCLQPTDGWTEESCDGCEHFVGESCRVLDMWGQLMESTRREVEEVPF